jgi:lipoate-protein ligase A
MEQNWRLLIDEAKPGSINMATDFAILEAVARGEQPPTLRFYKWDKPTITIGYFQSPQEEVYLENAKTQAVNVIRRITGGGTVFHDQELTYSLVIPTSHPLIKGEILDSFKIVCQPLIEALNRLGIPAEYQPINDITAGDKKISGNAQIRKQGVLLQHGTILLNIEKESIATLLTGKGSNKQHIINQETGEKEVKTVNHVTRVGSLKDYLGETVFSDDFRESFEQEAVHFYEKQFNTRLQLKTLSLSEKKRVKTIAKQWFENPDWNLTKKKRSPEVNL